MRKHVDNAQLFINQLHYFYGHCEKLQKCFTNGSTKAQKLHIIQTTAGSIIKLLELYDACLRDDVILLINTPEGTKINCIETNQKIDRISDTVLTMRVSKLPEIIAFLEELKNNPPSELGE